jgi:hypothetical protein
LIARFSSVSVLLSIEKRKSFSVPYDLLIKLCETALQSLGLEITHISESSGLIEAAKPSIWPFKPKKKISLTVTTDSKVVAVAKIDMAKAASSGDLIVDRFFETLKGLIQDQV